MPAGAHSPVGGRSPAPLPITPYAGPTPPLQRLAWQTGFAGSATLQAWTCVATKHAGPTRPGPPLARIDVRRYRIMNRLSIAYAALQQGSLGLGPTNPERTNLPQEPSGIRRPGFAPGSTLLMPAFALPCPPAVLAIRLRRCTARSPTLHLGPSPRTPRGVRVPEIQPQLRWQAYF